MNSEVRVLIPNKISECSLINYDPQHACVSDTVAKTIAKKTGVDINKPVVEIIDTAKKELKCDTTRCVLEKMGDVGRVDIERNLKIKGPTDVSLLNNFHIDDTMKQWTLKWKDFFPYDFNMRNWEEKRTSLCTINMRELYNGSTNSAITSRIIAPPNTQPCKFRCAACVINTDVYSGRGIHWMALFVDMRAPHGPWTVEFFNSSGNAPSVEYASWMEKTMIQLEQLVESGATSNKPPILSKRVCVAHQRSRTECGVYSLFYIYARLNGVPCEYFMKNKIPDELMFEFRQHLFYDNRMKNMTEWSMDKWLGSGVVPKWE